MKRVTVMLIALVTLSFSQEFKWKFETSNRIESSPAVGRNGTVYVRSIDDYLYAVNPDGSEKWQIDYFTLLFTAPVVDSNGTIFVGAIGSVYTWFGILKIDCDGNIVGEFETGTSVYTPLAIGYNGVLYFGTQDGKFYALKPDGSLLWRITPEFRIDVVPAVGPDSTIYVGDNGYNFYAIDYDGSIKWNYPIRATYSTPAIGADGTIYVEETGKNLYAFSPKGEVLWTYYYGGGAHTSPAIAPDGTIYLAGWYDNSLHAITSTSMGLAQTPWPRYRHDNQHSGRIQLILPAVAERPKQDSGIDLKVRPIGKSLRISYALQEGENGKLLIYDTSGRLLEEMNVGGSGVAQLPLSFSSGVYFVRLVSQEQQLTVKAVLLR